MIIFLIIENRLHQSLVEVNEIKDSREGNRIKSKKRDEVNGSLVKT